MAEYIEKWSIVNRLIDIENEFQQYKPFHGFEHAMYRKICEAEIAIGKTQAADVAPVVRCKDCKYSTLPSMQTQIYGKPGTLTCHNRKSPCNRRNVASDDYCSYADRKDDNAT